MDRESFKDKVWLLLIDKIIIGLAIGVVFFGYDWWRTDNERRYLDSAKQVEREFERAKLSAELVPIFSDDKANPITKAYLLRSAIITGAIDSSAGLQLGIQLDETKLDETHIIRALAPAVPSGFATLARIGSAHFQNYEDQVKKGVVTYQSVQEFGKGSILSELLTEGARRLDDRCGPFKTDYDIAAHIFGLTVLASLVDSSQRNLLINHPCKALQLTGHIVGSLGEASSAPYAGRISSEYVSHVLTPSDDSSVDQFRLAYELQHTLDTLRYFGNRNVLAAMATLITKYRASQNPSTQSFGKVISKKDEETAAKYFYKHMLREMAFQTLWKFRLNYEPVSLLFSEGDENGAAEILEDHIAAFVTELELATKPSAIEKVIRGYQEGDTVERALMLLIEMNEERASDLTSRLAKLDDRLPKFARLRKLVKTRSEP